MKRFGRSFKRTVLASLCAATVLGVVGVPGAQADARPTNASVDVYTVKPGDSLSRIASKAGVSLSSLLSVNGFQRSTVILPGQSIVLPTGTTSSVSTKAVTSGASYTVKPGDSLSRIASKAGVSLSSLLSVNGFQRSTVILPGQSIVLPTDAQTPTTSSSTETVSPASLSPAALKLIEVVEFVKAQVGKPYRFGAAGPDAFDCSGLARAAFRRIGITLPHSSFQQSTKGSAVDWRNEKIRPGDLVFTFSSVNPTQISHVGIAISDSQWIEAPFTGADVRVGKMPSDSRIQAVRRIVSA